MITMDVSALNERIRSHAAGVENEVAALADPCIHDEALRTPFDVAIEHDNAAVVDVLAKSRAALNYTPALDDASRRRVKAIVREHFEERITSMEAHVERSMGAPVHLMRTPLLQACRHRNLHAMELLVARGAKLNAKDALGLDAPELCHMTGDDELLSRFIDACAAAGRRFPIGVDFVKRIVSKPALTRRALAHGSPSAAAKRLTFNLACALLDRDTVAEMIASGHALNDSRIDNSTPLVEAATSRLLWLVKHPESERLAGALHRAYDAGDKLVQSAVGADVESLIAELEELDEDALAARLFGEDEDEEGAGDPGLMPQPGEANPKSHDAELLERRLEMLDLLHASGLDVAACRAQELADLLDDVVLINEPRLLEKLCSLGVRFDPDVDDSPVEWAMRMGCFDMVPALEALGSGDSRRSDIVDSRSNDVE